MLGYALHLYKLQNGFQGWNISTGLGGFLAWIPCFSSHVIVLDHAGTIFLLQSELFSETFDLRRGGPRWNQIESLQEQREFLSIENSGLIGVTKHARVKRTSSRNKATIHRLNPAQRDGTRSIQLLIDDDDFWSYVMDTTLEFSSKDSLWNQVPQPSSLLFAITHFLQIKVRRKAQPAMG